MLLFLVVFVGCLCECVDCAAAAAAAAAAACGGTALFYFSF
jgi:hypothetical protein